MLIKYEDLIGKYVLIESSRFNINWGALICISVFSINGVIFLTIYLCKDKDSLKCSICEKCEKKKKVSSDFIDYSQSDKLTSEGK